MVRGRTRSGSSIDFEKPATELDTELDVEGTAKLSAEERAQKAQKAKEGKEAATARAGRKEDSTAAKATTRTPRRVPEVVRLAPERAAATRPLTPPTPYPRAGLPCMRSDAHRVVCAACRMPNPRSGRGLTQRPRRWFADDVGDGVGSLRSSPQRCWRWQSVTARRPCTAHRMRRW
jgi:hypothetical protein